MQMNLVHLILSLGTVIYIDFKLRFAVTVL